MRIPRARKLHQLLLRKSPPAQRASSRSLQGRGPDRFEAPSVRNVWQVRLGSTAQSGPIFDGSRPAEGVTNTNGAQTVTPSVTGDPSHRTRAIYDNVINQFAVEVNPRYFPRGGNTYCNIFASDVMQAMGAPLPHWVDNAGNPTPDGVGRELNANDTNLWLNAHGPSHGWQKVSAEEAQERANQGHPVVASWNNPGGIGHIGVVRPGEMGNGPALAQAGSLNTNSAHVYDIFPREGTEYWVHAGPPADGPDGRMEPGAQPDPDALRAALEKIAARAAAANSPGPQPGPSSTTSATASPTAPGSSAPSTSAPSSSAPGSASAPSSAPGYAPTAPSGTWSPSAPGAPGSSAPAAPRLPAAGLDLTHYSSDMELLLQMLVAAGLLSPEEAESIRSHGGALPKDLTGKLEAAVRQYQTDVLKMPSATGAWDAATVAAAQKQDAPVGGLLGAPATRTGASFGNIQFDDATDAINRSAAKWGVPPNFLKTIIAQESSGDWNKNNYTHSLRGDQMYPYIGMFRKTIESRLPGVNFDALAGNRDAQIDAAAGVIRKIYDQLQGMNPSYGWDNVACYYYSGRPTPDGWKDERGVSNRSYYEQTLKFWRFLEPGFDPKVRAPSS